MLGGDEEEEEEESQDNLLYDSERLCSLSHLQVSSFLSPQFQFQFQFHSTLVLYFTTRFDLLL